MWVAISCLGFEYYILCYMYTILVVSRSDCMITVASSLSCDGNWIFRDFFFFFGVIALLHSRKVLRHLEYLE